MRQTIDERELERLTETQRQALVEWGQSHEYFDGDGIYLPTIGEMMHFIWEHNEPIQLQHDGKIDRWVMRTVIHRGDWAGRELGYDSPVTPLWWYVDYILKRDYSS